MRNMERFKEWVAEINEQLNSGEFRIGHRYGYYAIDYGEKGKNTIIDTIYAGLTAKEVELFLTGATWALKLKGGD